MKLLVRHSPFTLRTHRLLSERTPAPLHRTLLCNPYGAYFLA
ncbi:MAG: hypothetical protein AAFS12_01390 [Cyanobacteria bacterium J06632_19]